MEVDSKSLLNQTWQRSERTKSSSFRINLPFSERRALLLFVDTLLINLAILAAIWVWSNLSQYDNLYFTLSAINDRWYWFPLLTISWWIAGWLADLYDSSIASRRLEIAGRTVVVGLLLLIGYLAIYFILPRNALPRWFFLYFIFFSLGSIIVWRVFYATIFKLPLLRHRIIIVGAGRAGNALSKVLLAAKSEEYQIIGFVDDDEKKRGQLINDIPVIGTSQDLRSLAQLFQINKIIAAIHHDLQPTTFQAMMDCHAMGISVLPMPSLYERVARRIPVEHINEAWVLNLLNISSESGHISRLFRRLLDITFGLLGLLGLTIALPFVALAIYLDDGGPLFYTQVRSGRDDQPFKVIKFRTMRADAEKNGRAQWAKKNDSRITRIGRILRKTRLDELPQVFNVLRGEMSIIGPRPERPEFISQLEQDIPFYRTRLVIKPGLTGWAQIRYGYGNTIADAQMKLQYDLYYIRHRSIWLDLYIISRTIGVVLRGGGL